MLNDWLSSTEESGRAHYIESAVLIFPFILVSLTKLVKSVPVSFITFIIYVKVISRKEGNGDWAVLPINSSSSKCSEKSLIGIMFRVTKCMLYVNMPQNKMNIHHP